MRLPAFHRLDLRVERRWSTDGGSVAVVAEWYNALLQQEAISWDCGAYRGGCTPQYVGPVTIPSLGVEGTF